MLWLFCHILKHYGRANFDPFLKRRARIVRKAFYAWTLQHSWLVTQHLRIQDKMRSNEAVCTGLLYQYQSWKQSSCLELVLCILCRRFHFLFLSLLCALFQIVNISKYFGVLGNDLLFSFPLKSPKMHHDDTEHTLHLLLSSLPFLWSGQRYQLGLNPNKGRCFVVYSITTEQFPKYFNHTFTPSGNTSTILLGAYSKWLDFAFYMQ